MAAKEEVSSVEELKKYVVGSDEIIARLVEENMGWAQAIARSVARAWNLDWQLDGLDGGAYEGLLFCARRYDPSMGVPFRAYARKRIHEASSEEARKSKAWQRGVGAGGDGDYEAREISFNLFDMFPELREGYLPSSESGGEDEVRSAIRNLLTSASVIAAFQENTTANPEAAVDYKRMLEGLAELEPVHQSIVWGIYWCGQSMRALAEEWGTDELTVIREHKEILGFINSRLLSGRARPTKKLKIRPSLRAVALNLKKKKVEPPFSKFLTGGSAAVGLILFCAALQIFQALERRGGIVW